jgi:hypothetical protein
VLPVHETPWATAWQAALYGPAGFYRQDRGPAGHFATSTQGGPLMGSVLAAALVRLMAERGLHTLVDVGCGRGELLTEVSRLAPALRCVGVDVVARPDLPADVEWVCSPGGSLLPPELSDLTGTLTGYREGRQVAPVPDGSCDLTAHVAMDSLGADELVDQRTVLQQLGVSGATPARELATRDPGAYLAALSTASAATALTARGSFGDFCWAFTSVRPAR